MNYFSLLPLSSFILHCIIGSYTFAKNPKGKTNRAFVVFTAVVAVWAFMDFFIWNLSSGSTALLLMRIQIVFWLPSALVVYYFISVIVKKKNGLLFYIFSGITIIFSLISVFTDLTAKNVAEVSWGIVIVPGPFYIVSILVCNTSVIIYSIYVLLYNYREAKDPILKSQLFYLSIGSIVTYASVFFVNVIVNVVLNIDSVPAFGTLLVLLQSLFISIAIVRYNFLLIGVKETVNELFTQINDAVIIFNQNGEIIEINNKALGFFGIDNIENVTYGNIFPDEYLYDDEYFNKELSLEINGETRYGLLSQSALKEKEISLGKLVIIRDVTLLRAKENERALLKEQVRQSQAVKMEAIGQLAGGIAHDFNNMLTAISGYAELINRESYKHSEKLNRFAKRIIAAIRRASDLTKKLLAFARKGKYEMVAIDLHKVINEVINLLKHSIDKRIIIKDELKAKNHIIKGDLTQIENAVLNIGLNARDAMINGGELKFRTSNVSLSEIEDNELFPEHKDVYYLMISISDTGCGINEEIKSRIFEPFFTTKEKGKGTGLGLASVYGTIQNHNGFIRMESTVNEGTTFNVYLPSTMEAVRDDVLKDISEKNIDKDGIVLVIDDEQLALDSSTDMLSSLGFNVIPKNNGYDGIGIYDKLMEQINFILLDLNMPEINGYDCLKELRKINKDIKVIIISGYYIDYEVKKMSEEKNLVFLKKPFTMDELVNSIFKLQKMD